MQKHGNVATFCHCTKKMIKVKGRAAKQLSWEIDNRPPEVLAVPTLVWMSMF